MECGLGSGAVLSGVPPSLSCSAQGGRVGKGLLWLCPWWLIPVHWQEVGVAAYPYPPDCLYSSAAGSGVERPLCRDSVAVPCAV